MSGNIREDNYFYMPTDNPKRNQTIYLRYAVQVQYTMNITVNLIIQRETNLIQHHKRISNFSEKQVTQEEWNRELT